MNFKDQVERDLKNVFHNTAEFATELEFWYDGSRYKAPVILDSDDAEERGGRLQSDHVEGLTAQTLTLCVPLEIMKKVPKQGRPVVIGDDEYTVQTAGVEDGEIIIALMRLDE